jgi:hypothetical protein
VVQNLDAVSRPAVIFVGRAPSLLVLNREAQGLLPTSVEGLIAYVGFVE